MAEYKGSKCIVCEKIFDENDDIVVCPDCGTPYHRECYMKNGTCINEKLHISKMSWEPDNTPKPASKRICIRCRTENPEGSLYCCRCGMPFNTVQHYGKNTDTEGIRMMKEDIRPAPLHDDNYQEKDINLPGTTFYINFSDPLCGMNPSEQYDENVNLAELGAYVDSNTHYYLPRFKIMKETKTKISLNMISVIFPEFFFANRKMPFWGLLCMIIKLITILPSIINNFAESGISTGIVGYLGGMFDVRGASFQTLISLAQILNVIFTLGISALANHIYFNHCLNKIPQIKKSVPPAHILPELHRRGGTSVGLLIGFIAIEFIAAALYYFAVYLSIAGI